MWGLKLVVGEGSRADGKRSFPIDATYLGFKVEAKRIVGLFKPLSFLLVGCDNRPCVVALCSHFDPPTEAKLFCLYLVLVFRPPYCTSGTVHFYDKNATKRGRLPQVSPPLA